MSNYIESLNANPVEIRHVFGKLTSALPFRLIPQLARALMDLEPYNAKRVGSYTVYLYTIAAQIWVAGRIYGIREERARRKTKLDAQRKP